MKKIVHISDLHFGRENRQVVASLLEDIIHYQPDVVVVSGDLTQRARKSQFIKAAQFLERIPFPKVIVPGNHDVPLYDVTRRFLAPFNRYIRYINDDFFPIYNDDEFAVIGINTAYSFTWKSGRVTESQLQTVKEKFQNEGNKLKMLAIHHPFHELFYGGRYQEILNELSIDLIFSGHLHQASASVLDNHVAMLNQKTLLVQSGTSVSTRLRHENNSFNQVEISSNTNLTIIIKEYNNQQFVEKKRTSFKKYEGKWLLNE